MLLITVGQGCSSFLLLHFVYILYNFGKWGLYKFSILLYFGPITGRNSVGNCLRLVDDSNLPQGCNKVFLIAPQNCILYFQIFLVVQLTTHIGLAPPCLNVYKLTFKNKKGRFALFFLNVYFIIAVFSTPVHAFYQRRTPMQVSNRALVFLRLVEMGCLLQNIKKV